MALKQCNECKKEISTTVSVCPNCGCKKPFKGVKLSREETKYLSLEERKSFEEAGGKVTIGKVERIWKLTLFLIKVGVVLFLISFISDTFNKNEAEEKIKKAQEIEKLEKTVKSIPSREVEKNFNAYKKLSSYYPDNERYKNKLTRYENLLRIEVQCEIDSRKKNRLLLKYPDTYESIVIDEYEYSKWIDNKTIIHQSSFYGKNAFGVKQRFIKKYKCVVTGDNTFTITRIN